MADSYHGPADLVAKARLAASRALNETAREIERKSVQRAPMETGALRESVRVVEASLEDLTASVSFDSPHAAEVHEGEPRDEVRHYSPASTGPKFLEHPLLEEVPRLPERLARELRREFRD